jgi:hypothetical protein
MGIANSISRFTAYYTRHGFGATIRRAGLAVKRALFSSRMVVFYCDLPRQTTAAVNIPSSLEVVRLRSYTKLSPQDLQEMTSFWNPKQVLRNIEERFEKEASLWLIKSGERLAGYGWTIQGRAISPYYFPMGPGDVQLFDFYVFPKFRGRAIHWLLTVYILRTLAAEGGTRAFADTGEWNQAQLASFKMTPFRRLGLARTITIFGHMFTCWTEDEAALETQKETETKDQALAAARSHER